MKKILTVIIILIFFTYWILTLIFTMPDNFINISFYKEELVFNSLLSQKWSFFAPPPNYNERLYFIFSSKKDSKVQIFEIIEALNIAKQKNAPFNRDEDVLDDVLSNSINGIDEGINEIHDYLNSEKKEGILKADSTIERISIETVQKSIDFITLKNYAKLVAKKNNINPDDYNVQIRITKKYLPKFQERNNESIKLIETIVFQSQVLQN